MDNEKIYTSTVRLYKKRPLHNQAYEYLMQRNKDIFKTNDDFIAEAIVFFSQHLRKEQEKAKLQEINSYLGDMDNSVLRSIRIILEEVLEEKLIELYDKMMVLGGESIDSLKAAQECTDQDKQFAAFYNY